MYSSNTILIYVLIVPRIFVSTSVIPIRTLVSTDDITRTGIPEKLTPKLDSSIVSVRLLNESVHLCTGVILSDNTVLTQADCVLRYGLTPENINVFKQSNLPYEYELNKSAKSVSIAPNYSNLTMEHNLAIIKLSDPFFYFDEVNAVEMRHTPIPDASICNEYYWNEHKQFSMLNRTIITNEECRAALFNAKDEVTYQMICAKQAADCLGDSGRPLFYNDQLVGLSNQRCSYKQPSDPIIYTDVSQYLKWIQEETAPDFPEDLEYPQHIINEPDLYQVLLKIYARTGDQTICGGSIIDAQHVLTAASCVHHVASLPENIKIISNSITNNGGHSRPTRVIIHSKFQSGRECPKGICTPTHDIAILKMEKPFSSSITPILLNTEPVHEGTACEIFGWGKTEHEETSEFLVVLDVKIVEPSTCISNWKKFLHHGKSIQNGMICAEDENKVGDSCKGDGGGPLVCNGKLTGIISFGDPDCRSSLPAVHTEVKNYDLWLVRHIPALAEQFGGFMTMPLVEAQAASASMVDISYEDIFEIIMILLLLILSASLFYFLFKLIKHKRSLLSMSSRAAKYQFTKLNLQGVA